MSQLKENEPSEMDNKAEKQSRIASLRKDRNKLNAEIDSYHNRLNEEDSLDSLIQQEKWNDEIYGRISNQKELIDKTEKSLNEQRKKYKILIEKRKKVFLRLSVIFPSIIILLYAALILLLNKINISGLITWIRNHDIHINQFVIWSAGLFIIAVLYLVYAYFRYQREVGRDMRSTKSAIKSLELQKVNNLNDFIALHNEFYQSKFKLQLYNYAWKWIQGFEAKVNQHINKIQKFIETISEKKEDYNKALREEKFSDSLFEQQIIAPEDIERFFSDAKKRTFQLFFNEDDLGDRRISNYLGTYFSSGNIEKLDSDIIKIAERHFSDIYNKNIKEILFGDEIIRDRIQLTNRFRILLESSSALIDINKDLLTKSLNTLSKIHVPFIKGMRENIEEVLKSTDHSKTQYVESDMTDRITRSIMQVGFPAHSITQFRNIKEDIGNEKSLNIENFFIDPQKYSKYDMITTSVKRKRSKSNQFERCVYKALALGILTYDKGEVIYKSKKFASIKDTIIHLDSIRGEDDFNSLNQEIETILEGCFEDESFAKETIESITLIRKKIIELKVNEVVDDLIKSINPM